MSLRNGFLRLLFVGLCANTAHVCADQTVPAIASDRAESPQLLILKSWRVVKGMIRSRGDGYVIDHLTGREFTSSQDVWLIATDLEDAHLKMRDSIQTITPDVNMRLAEWCASQQMWGTAKQELLDALHQDPYREEARKMLARVMAAQQAAAAPAGRRASKAVDPSVQTENFFPRKTLGGLNTELARDFTRQIQPLLSNTCGDCHHTRSDREFVLHVAHRNKRSDPRVSGQNLQAIIGQLDPADVDNSPLLTYSVKPHGGIAAAPFRGRLASQHQQKLKRWSTEVVKALGQRSTGRASKIAARTTELQRQSQPKPVNDAAVTPAAYVVGNDNPQGNDRHYDQLVSSQLTAAAKRNRIDPFNPEIFNQRHRGRSVSTTSSPGRSARRSP